MVMTFLDRRGDFGVSRSSENRPNPSGISALSCIDGVRCRRERALFLKLYTMPLFRVCTRLLTAFFITERMRKKSPKKFFSNNGKKRLYTVQNAVLYCRGLQLLLTAVRLTGYALLRPPQNVISHAP